MRTEREVMQMIAELREIRDRIPEPHQGRDTAKAIIAALENVLHGPTPAYGDERDSCGCVGPSGCCLCTIRRLALIPMTVEEVDARLASRPPFTCHLHGVGKFRESP